MSKSTKYYSDLQEKHIAKLFGVKPNPCSGGTKFSGGDVIVEDILIEAKTTTTEKSSFSVKKQWLDKVREQAFEQRCDSWALAFRFSPEGKDYYVLSEEQFYDYVKYRGRING
jgi:hypothetical protein